MKKLFILAATAWSALTAATQTPSFVSDSIDQYIEQGIKDWKIPGLSIVIVKDGKTILMKGYGVRSLDTKAPVDENTLFMIASNTKLFTGTSLALLETRGKLSLNDRITKYFPDYRLYDSTTTKIVTIRDLLSHRIGTKTFQGDFTFWNTRLSREEVMRRMRLLKPSQIFRQDYGYCNSCFLTAGQVIPKVTGKQWEQFVSDSLLTPLEMTQTMILSTGVENQPNVAVPYDNWNNLAPAASIISSVHDLSHWLLMQLDSGVYKGKRILPFEVLQKTRDVNLTTNSRKSPVYPSHFRGYGLGLFTTDYNGKQVYWHTGGAGGMVSNVCFVPEEHLGIAILTNNDNQNFFELLRYQILDAYLHVPYVNRSQQQLSGFNKDMQQQVGQINQWQNRVKGNRPELSLRAYAGAYENNLYGAITIRVSGNKLIINFSQKPELEGILEYMDHGDWLLTYNNIEYGIFSIRFTIEQGKVRAVTTRQNEFVEYDPYTFLKR